MVNVVRNGKGRHTVVLVHGFLGGAGYWVQLTSGLKDHFDFVSIDLPGFAGSANVTAPDSLSGLADCVLQTADSLGIERFSLLGFSMGGMVAMQAALMRPDSLNKLVLYGTAASGDLPDRFESWDASIDRIQSQGVEATADKTVTSWFVEGQKHPFYGACREACKGASKEGCIKAMRGMQRWSARERLKEIKKPTLVLVGDKDRSTKPAESVAIWQQIPDAQLGVIPNAAHGAHMEKPDVFNRLVLDFLLGS